MPSIGGLVIVISVVVLLVAILYGFCRQQQQNDELCGRLFHNTVDGSILQPLVSLLIPNNENGGTAPIPAVAPTIWTVTPNSTGLLVDATIFQHYVGSKITMLEEPPPTISSNHDDTHDVTSDPTTSTSSTLEDCVYLFLEVTPNNSNAPKHPQWETGTGNTAHSIQGGCRRVMVMVNTDQFILSVLDTPRLELLLCKTRQCVAFVQRQQQQVVGSTTKRKIPIVYIGFTSMVPAAIHPTEHTNDLERYNRFLHVAGQSPHKGTLNILQAWFQHPHWPTLTVTSYNNKVMELFLGQMQQQLGTTQFPPNIHHIDTKLSRTDMDVLLWRHGVHLCLSGMEGFGHYLNEARAVKAMTITTQYPPMNELITSDTGVLVEPTNMLTWTNSLPFANVGPDEIVHTMKRVVLPMSLSDRAAKGQKAQEAFEHDQRRFQHRVDQLKCFIGANCSNSTAQSQGDAEQALSTCAEQCGLVLE